MRITSAAVLLALAAITACNDARLTEPPVLATPRRDLTAAPGPAVFNGPMSLCALRSSGVLQCRGVPEATFGSETLPLDWTVASGAVVKASVSTDHACVLRTDGAIECKGWNDFGESPAEWTAGPGLTFTDVTAGDDGDGNPWTCAVRSDGVIVCVGAAISAAPATVTPANGTFTKVASGEDHTCGLRSDGHVQCWGVDEDGEAVADRAASSGSFVDVSTYHFNTCGLRTDGHIECWGASGNGVPSELDQHVGGYSFTQSAAGTSLMCGLLVGPDLTGAIQCRGVNADTVTHIANGSYFVDVSVAGTRICGMRADDLVACYGPGGDPLALSEQNVSFTSTPPVAALIGVTFTVSAVSTSGLTTSLGSTTFDKCETNTDGTTGVTTVTLLAAGTCAIQAAAPASGGYLAATDTLAFTVLGLAKPGTFAAIPAGAHIGLTWVDASTSETRYELRRRSSITFGLWQTLAPLPANSTSFDDTDVIGSVSYQYGVRACENAVCAAWAVSKAVYTVGKPAAPASLQITNARANAIDMTWTDESSEESSFEVQRRTRDLLRVYGAWTTIATTAADAQSYTDTGMQTGYAHEYHVRACNVAGCSAWSNIVSAVAGSKPAVPTPLVATVISSSTIDLTWNDASDAETNFELRRRANVGGVWTGWVDVAYPAANATAYTSTGLTAATRYQYEVRACNAAGCSSYAVSATIVTLP